MFTTSGLSAAADSAGKMIIIMVFSFAIFFETPVLNPRF